jgi:hypothetical protein
MCSLLIFGKTRYLMHWPVAFVNGKGVFPKGDDGKGTRIFCYFSIVKLCCR